MFPAITDLASTALSLGGLSGGLDFLGFGADQYQANKARQFNKDMYASRYQLTTSDMRKAGLNPMLAATQGVGGNVAPAALPHSAQGLGSRMMQGVLARETAKQATQQTTNLVKQNEKLGAEIDNLRADIRLKDLEGDKQNVMKGLYEVAIPVIQYIKDNLSSARASDLAPGKVLNSPEVKKYLDHIEKTKQGGVSLVSDARQALSDWLYDVFGPKQVDPADRPKFIFK